MKTVIRKNISDRMLKTMKNQMLPERGEGCRCKGKTPKTFMYVYVGREACSLLFSLSCCLFLSLLLLLLVPSPLELSGFFSLLCSLLSVIYLFLLLSCLLLLLHIAPLVVPLLSNMFSPSLLDGNFFR